MRATRSLLIVLAVVAFGLMLLLNFVLNVVSSLYVDALRPYAGWLFALLGVLALLSLGVLIWQMAVEQRDRRHETTSSVRQTAAKGGQISRSPVTLEQSRGASAEQKAEGGKIINSGINITDAAGAAAIQTAKDGGSIESSSITIR